MIRYCFKPAFQWAMLSMIFVSTAELIGADLNTVGSNDVKELGFPEGDQEAILEVAREYSSVILIRPPGIACLELLKEGYDAKSFHLKAKSCDWGPMMGFVCLDPRFSKKGGEGQEYNLDEMFESFNNRYDSIEGVDDDDHADGRYPWVVPIAISDRRKRDLFADRSGLKGAGDSQSRDRWEIKEHSKSIDGIKYALLEYLPEGRRKHVVNFILLKDEPLVSGGPDVWFLYYDFAALAEQPGARHFSDRIKSRLFKKRNVTATRESISDDRDLEQISEHLNLIETQMGSIYGKDELDHEPEFLPVFGVANPDSPGRRKYDHKRAVTGDYDLFAIWPHVDHGSSADQRVAGMNKGTTDDQIVEGEKAGKIGRSTGNISERAYEIGQMINSKIGAPFNRVYHSDEAGRPEIDSVDAAVVFDPDGETMYEIRDGRNAGDDLSALIKHYTSGENQYRCYVNKGWLDELDNDAREKVSWTD